VVAAALLALGPTAPAQPQSLPENASVWFPGAPELLAASEIADLSALPEGAVVMIDTVTPAVGDEAAAWIGGGANAFNPAYMTLDLLSTGVSPEGDMPQDLAFTPDGQQIVVCCRDSQNLQVFGAVSGELTRTIPISGSPASLVITPDGQTVLTANVLEDTVSIIDFASGAEITTVPVGDDPGLIKITPDGSFAVTANIRDGTLSVINVGAQAETHRFTGLTFSVTANIAVATGRLHLFVRDFALAPDSQTLLVPNRLADEVRFYDLVSGSLVTLPVFSEPAAVDITDDGTVGVVVHSSDPIRMSLLDMTNHTVTQMYVFVGYNHTVLPNVALNAAGTHAVVSAGIDVLSVDLSDGSVYSPTFDVSVEDMAFTADGNRCFVTQFDSYSLLDVTAETMFTGTLPQGTANNVATSPVSAERAALTSAVIYEAFALIDTGGIGPSHLTFTPSGPSPEGDGAVIAAVTPDGQTVAVINEISENIAFLDLETGTTLDVLPSGGHLARDIQVSSDGSRVIVASLQDQSVFPNPPPVFREFDLPTLDIMDTTDAEGREFALSPDGDWAYLAGGRGASDTLRRVDLTTHQVVSPTLTIGTVQGGDNLHPQPTLVDISPDGSTLAIANGGSDDVSVVDVGTWTEIARVPVTENPVSVLFSPVSPELYVAEWLTSGSSLSGEVAIINLTGGTPVLEQTISTMGIGPKTMTLTADGSTLYVGRIGGVDVIDVQLGEVVRSIPLTGGQIATGIALNPAEDLLFISAGLWTLPVSGSPFDRPILGQLLILDAATETVLHTVDLGTPPASLILDWVNGRALMPAPLGDGLIVVDGLIPPTAARRWRLYR
jgi:YVTN family beta-propeller protein